MVNMRDFSLAVYHELLQALLRHGYSFSTMEAFVSSEPRGHSIVLRHDVDKLPENAFQTALLESNIGISATYYFRMIDSVFKPDIIIKISGLGHEIGYHYENMDTCKGDLQKAFQDFKINLDKLRQLVPVKTACMHGSPLSRWDNRDLWGKYDYRTLGIIAEPYFDLNFKKVFYLTDTGRRWDGHKVSIRDKAMKTDGVDNLSMPSDRYRLHSTMDIIRAAKENRLPDLMMINTHPQRWDDRLLPWGRELVLQNLKNVVKRCIVR